MRLFKLKNARGLEFDLMRNDAFFSHPDGLGFSKSMNFITSGESFIKTSEESDQKTPNGEMVFAGYKEYSEFAKFCVDGPLTLCYNPGFGWFYLDCEITSIGKTEIDTSNRLIAPIDFIGIGKWYESAVVSQTDITSEDNKRYAYKYPYTYSGGRSGIVILDNTATMDSPCRLLMYGPCTSPQWTLSQKGTVVATGKVDVYVRTNELLAVDSSAKNMEITIYDSQLMREKYSAYDLSDFSTERFIFLPPGKSMLTFSHEGTSIMTAIVEAKYLAETV